MFAYICNILKLVLTYEVISLHSNKKLIIDSLIFIVILVIVMIFLSFKDSSNSQSVARIKSIGYSTTIGNSSTTTTTIDTSTKLTTTLDTISTTTITTTLESLVEFSRDYSSIARASLPSDYCNKVYNLKYDNPDTRGWITITNTNINYAFTQSEDNYFYLDHDFYGNEDHSGWVFMDFRNSFDDNGQQSDVLTLYGHNMANGSMFSTLKKYRDNSDFYEANPIITISSVNGYKYYKIYAYMICNGLEGSDFEFWKYSDLSDPNDFYYYVNRAFDKSLIITGVDVQYGDKLLALSTCNTGSSTNHDRFVVLARMVRDGEDIYEGCYRVK